MNTQCEWETTKVIRYNSKYAAPHFLHPNMTARENPRASAQVTNARKKDGSRLRYIPAEMKSLSALFAVHLLPSEAEPQLTSTNVPCS